MVLIGLFQVFLVGFSGGVILELMHWYNLRQKATLPTYSKSVKYWVITAAMAATGGLLTMLYFGSRADGIVALHVGLSTPLILQKLTTTIATVSGAKGGEAGILEFFRW
jgi:hypothetical protein